MDSNFQPGDTLYHKATLKRLAVIKLNEDGTIKVRTEDNQEFDYYPQELKRPNKTNPHVGGVGWKY